MVAVWYVMWSNIGNVQEHINSIDFLPSVSAQGSEEELHRTSGHKDAMIIFANFTSSMKGLFAGFLMVVITVSMLILHFFLLDECDIEDYATSTWIANATEWTSYGVMIIATIAAYIKVAQLDVNPHPISFLDDLLLFLCIPSFILYALVCLIPDLFPGSMDLDYLITQLLTVSF